MLNPPWCHRKTSFHLSPEKQLLHLMILWSLGCLTICQTYPLNHIMVPLAIPKKNRTIHHLPTLVCTTIILFSYYSHTTIIPYGHSPYQTLPCSHPQEVRRPPAQKTGRIWRPCWACDREISCGSMCVDNIYV